MASNDGAEIWEQDRVPHGTWRGVVCSVDDCDRPSKCKGMCQSHYNKARWAAGLGIRSAEGNRRAHLKHRYGLTMEEHDRLLREQGGVCGVCGEPPSRRNIRSHWRSLCVDHDHDTGRVRGLLCNDCNLMVGYGRTPDRLRAAADYLERHL